MRSWELCAFNVEKKTGGGDFLWDPIAREHRDNMKLQNWVIISFKWIPRTIITLAVDMQIYMAVNCILSRAFD